MNVYILIFIFFFILVILTSLIDDSLSIWISFIACSLHFISSVGHNVNEEKNAAKNPAHAFWIDVKSCIFWTPIWMYI